MVKDELHPDHISMHLGLKLKKMKMVTVMEHFHQWE